MRTLAVIGTILLILLTGGFWTTYSLVVSTHEISREIDQVYNAVKDGQWQTAAIRTGRLETVWEEKARWWPIFLDHQEMDNIDFSMARVKEYVNSRSAALSLGQLSELKLMVEHIPAKETVNLKNIL